MGAGKLEGGSVWGYPHNFISLGAPKDHNPAHMCVLFTFYIIESLFS
jgi:hypothetical protein